MAGISREERERRRLAAEGAKQPLSERLAHVEDRAIITVSNALNAVSNAVIDAQHIAAAEAANKAGKTESRHWPGLFYDASDPEPEQSNMLGTKDPVWRAWFERNGGKLK